MSSVTAPVPALEMDADWNSSWKQQEDYGYCFGYCYCSNRDQPLVDRNEFLDCYDNCDCDCDCNCGHLGFDFDLDLDLELVDLDWSGAFVDEPMADPVSSQGCS